MAGKLISELSSTEYLQPGDFIPIARGTSTLKLPGNALISRDVQGRFNLGPSLITGAGAFTEDCNIEVGGSRIGSGYAYIDLHSVSGTDYEARFLRGPGVNGDTNLQNRGTGNLNITQEGAGSIRLNTANTERMRVSPVGYIGVGQPSPESALHITGDQGAASDIILEAIQSVNTTDTTGPAFIFRHKGGQNFAKTNDIISVISSRGYSTAAGQIGYQTVGQIQTIATGDFNSIATRNADMTFGTSQGGIFAERLRIKSDGRIGIGTTTPATTLDVQPGLLTLGRTDLTSEGGELRFCRASDNAAVWSIDQIGTGTSSSGSLRIFNTQTGAMRMFINPDGKVGIGNTTPEANLHVTGSEVLLKVSGSTGEHHGMIIKTADASSSAGRLAFWDHQNENNAPVSSMHSYAHIDGGSDLYFHTTPPGARNSDRRVERMRFDKSGNVQLNVNCAGIGRAVDGNYRLAVSGRTYSNSYRAEQGVPNAGDSSTTGYAFGADGDTGMFSSNTGAGAGTLGFYTNGNRAMYLDGSAMIIDRNLSISNGQLSVNQEFQVSDTPNSNQLRLVQGNYGVIQRNDGSNFYLLATYSGAPFGNWNTIYPFAFNLATGNVTLGHNVVIGGNLSVNGTIAGNGSGITNIPLNSVVGLQQELTNRINVVQNNLNGNTSSLQASIDNKIQKPSSPQNGHILLYNNEWISSPFNLTGDVVSSGFNTTYNNVVPTNKGGAGSVNGILKANGQGSVSQAVPSVDYTTPADLTNTQNNLQNNINGKIDKPASPSSGHVLTYDGSANTWISKSPIPEYLTVSEPAVGLPVKQMGQYNGSYYTKNQIYFFGNTFATGYTNETYNPPARGMFLNNYLLKNPSLTITKVVDALRYVIVLLSDGTLWASGNLYDIFPQNIYAIPAGNYSGIFIPLNGLFSNKSVSDFSVSATFGSSNLITIAILCTDGSAFAWGHNGNGQLGRGGKVASTSPVAINVPGKTIAQVSAGGWGNTSNILLRMTDGTLFAAGYNAHGQLGVGDTTERNTFIQCRENASTFVTNVAKICDSGSIQASYTRYIIKNNGTLWGTGLNNKYQLGNGTTSNSSYYKQIFDVNNNALTNITKVVTAGDGAQTVVAALNSSGNVYTWGESGFGTTGQGSATDVTKPTQVTLYRDTPTTTAPLPSIRDIVGTDCRDNGAIGLISISNQLFTAGCQIFPPITLMMNKSVSTNLYYRFELASVENVEQAMFYTNETDDGADSRGTIVRDKGGIIWVWGYGGMFITPNDRTTSSPIRVNY